MDNCKLIIKSKVKLINENSIRVDVLIKEKGQDK